MKLFIAVTVCLLVGLTIAHRPVMSTPKNDYPAVWADLPPGAILDSWGNGIKDCTSWVAWRAWEDLRYKVDRWGEAKNWPDKAREAGLLVDTVPSLNSAMINTNFSPGHAMWVEKINADGTVRVSEYNLGGKGEYDERDYSTYAMVFIHFPKVKRAAS